MTHSVEWFGYQMVKKINICLFFSTESMNVTDRQTDGRQTRGRRMQVGQANIEILSQYLAVGLMTAGVLDVQATSGLVDRIVYRTDRHASANLVYHSWHGRPRRREQNGI